MRILLLCNKSPWPPKDGGAVATLNIIKGLTHFNMSVTVLAVNTSKHFVKAEDIPDELRKLTDYQLIYINTSINPFLLFLNLLLSEKPYNLERYWSLKYCKELNRIIKNNFDIVQIEGLSMFHYLSVVRSLTSVPVVYRPHNIENIIWSGLRTEEKNILKRIYFNTLAIRIKKIEKNIINDFDAILPISTNDLNWFKKEGLMKPSMVLSPGFDPGCNFEHTPSTSKKVFFIGALDWRPNINGLVWFINNVWPIVIKEIPDAEFIIAGRNASVNTISHFRGTNISFTGEVESSYDFIKDKTVMVVPLFSGSGIRLKILECMSMGKCIVATPLAAEGLQYENGKNIFIASDARDFAEYIMKLILNEDLRRTFGENANKNVRENYNILASSKKLINFYKVLTA
jgi:polysaccharide biosynthesis protein PslH